MSFIFFCITTHSFSQWYSAYSLKYTRSYLFSWTRRGMQRNDHSSWNLFNLTAVIESTLVLEYTRPARRLIGFIVEIHRRSRLARATRCARALLPTSPAKESAVGDRHEQFGSAISFLVAVTNRQAAGERVRAGPTAFEEQTPLGFLHLAKRSDAVNCPERFPW